jgi:hypothetical protein
MTREQVKEILERVMSWPRDHQEQAAQMLLLLEGQEGEMYHSSDDEWEAIQEGLAQAERGEFGSNEDMEHLWKRLGA